jgi:AraC-like DNA-binding protein
MKKFFLFILSVIYFQANSQTKNNQTSFDSIYYEITVNILASDPLKALHLSDSLYTYSIDDTQRMKSIMLTATIYEKKEQRMESIDYAMQALEIAKKTNHYSFQARIYGFMSTQYRILGFSDKGKEYIQKGLAISSKIENREQVTKYQAMANHELADYAMDEHDYKKAIDYMNLALLGYQKEEDPRLRSFQLANAEELLGRSNLALGNEDLAFQHFSSANSFINDAGSGNSIWASKIYQGFGETFLQKNQLDSAGSYLKKAFQIAEESEHGALKELLYESMAKYYDKRNELDSSTIFASKFREISKENKFKKKQSINSEVNRLTKEVPVEKSDTYIPLIIIGTVIGLGILFTLYYIRKRNISNSIEEDEIQERNLPNGVLISDRTNDMLVKKLNEFEASGNYLDNNMSFSVLSGYLNTNSKYLNYILKKEKNKDFNTYINDLRIEYIISKLKSDPDFLNYKISYLAEVSGFSSHSNFSANFKRVTDLSPSEFIGSLNHSA